MVFSITCTIFLQGSIQLLSCCLYCHLHQPIHLEHKWPKGSFSFKTSLNIFDLLVPLMLRQDFVWVYILIECCICVNKADVKDTHPTRGTESYHSHIPMEVRTNLVFLRIGIPPCAPSPDTPTFNVRHFYCCHIPLYFGFDGHCSWGVRLPSHLLPLLVQYIILETYTPPPPNFNGTCAPLQMGLCTNRMPQGYY